MNIDVVIVGSGPYGLSIGAQMRDHPSVRVFGPPMYNWRNFMPAGMCLKSDGFATNLFPGEGRFTLKDYCTQEGIEYQDMGLPVRVELFSDYGDAFQAKFLPHLDPKLVTSVSRTDEGFRLRLEDGRVVNAYKVIFATGISYIQNIPEQLANLGPKLCSHSSLVGDLRKFAGRKIVVVGAGSSATDDAALLQEAGADATIVCRRPVQFHNRAPDTRRTLWQKIRKPNFGLGPGLRSSICVLFPGWFRVLPLKMRRRIVKNHLGPAGGWFMKDKVIGKVPIHHGFSLVDARPHGEGVQLKFQSADGTEMELFADHVIAGTGYRASISKVDILDPAIRAAIRTEDDAPILSRNFESSVPGLYFVGPLAVMTFGPLMRFALGADYAGKRLARHLRRLPVRFGARAEAQAPPL
jgi:thioredoxin reductase